MLYSYQVLKKDNLWDHVCYKDSIIFFDTLDDAVDFGAKYYDIVPVHNVSRVIVHEPDPSDGDTVIYNKYIAEMLDDMLVSGKRLKLLSEVKEELNAIVSGKMDFMDMDW